MLHPILISASEVVDLFAEPRPGTFDGRVVRDEAGRELAPHEVSVESWGVEWSKGHRDAAFRGWDDGAGHGGGVPASGGCKVTAAFADVVRAAVASGYMSAAQGESLLGKS
jgi:hypothetical protein